MDDQRFREQEIDLLDLLLRLAEQWRGILIISVLFALLVSAVMLMKKDTTDPNTINDVQVTETTNVEDVYQQICTALSQYANYMLAKNTYDNSIVNRNDYKNIINVTLKYRIESVGSNKEMPSESDSDQSDIFMLTNLYSSIMDDGDFSDAVLKEADRLWDDVNPNSLGEIFGVSAAQDIYSENSRTGLLTVSFKVPDDANTQELEKALTVALNKYREKISPMSAGHNIRLISMTSKNVDNNLLTSAQNKNYTDLIAAKNTYDKTVSALSESDKALVKKIISDNEGSYDIAVYISSLDKELEAVKENAQKPKAPEVQPVQPPADNSFSAKYAILGFILGCFVYAGIYFMYFVFIRLVRDEYVLERTTGARNFGGIYEYPYAGCLQRFLHDKKIYAFRTRKGKTAEAINEDIVSKLNYINTNRVNLISVGKMSNGSSTFADSQIKYLSDHQLSVSQFNIEDDVNAVRDSQFTEMKDVIILLLGNKSKWANVCALYFKLREYGINIVGSEFVDS